MTVDERHEKALARFERFYPEGSVIFRENDPGEEMFVIRDGQVEVTKTIRGKTKLLSMMGKGDFFGEMAILNSKPRSATVSCLTDCKLLVLDARTFEGFLRSDIEVSIRLVKKLAQRLQAADDQIENLMLGDEESVVVNTLKKILAESDRVTADGVVLGATPKEIANRIGIEQEQLKEILTKLKRLEVVLVKNRQVVIPSKQRLDKYLKLLEMQNDFYQNEQVGE